MANLFLSPRFTFLIIFTLLFKKTVSQSNLICDFTNNINKNYDTILNILNTKVVLRDSLSFTKFEGKAIQNDPSKIILPDSCTIVLLYEIKYLFTSKPDLKYLMLVEKLGSFTDTMTNNYLFETVQELTLSNVFINLLGDHPELNNTDHQFFSVLESSAPESEYILNVKKWLKRNPAKKETDFYKKVGVALSGKK